MKRADKSKHLTPSKQAEALAEWGTLGSYRCCACSSECTGGAGTTVPTPFAIHLAACYACARRMRLSPAYRRQVRANARNAGLRVIYQRTADLAGVTGAALVDAMRARQDSDLPTVAQLRAGDATLGLPMRTLETALLCVLGMDTKQ